MFKKIKLPRASGAKIKQRGQIFLIYALLIPFLFFFVGITFDLSWYYVNVTRMQNAADAAVIAGAQTLIGENGNLYCYMDKTFVDSYNSKDVAEFYQDTTLGDTIAKTYVRKNLAKKSSSWDSDTIIDSWTRNELYFESTLLGSKNDNFETLYYHVMLEEDVPHMFLNGWFDSMNAKVSAVVKISQYMKGYDFFEQMKYLGYKHSRLAMNDTNNPTRRDLIDARTVLVNRANPDYANNRLVETFNFYGDDGDKNIFDYLFAALNADAPSHNANMANDDKTSNRYKLTHRIINIDSVYPVRDYGFYSNYNVLRKIREENSAYDDLDDNDLASALAKESYDPMYIRIEPEIDFARQLIINVNVSNIDENTRPIVLIYEGPVYDESKPVILNLNADFRGILYAPNSPVVINGNENDFLGFIIAKSYVELVTENEDDFYDVIENEYIDDYGEVQYNNVMLVDVNGEVQYKKNYDGSYQTIPYQTGNNEIFFEIDKFNLNNSEFDSFDIVKLENYTAPPRSSNLINNLFIQPPDNVS